MSRWSGLAAGTRLMDCSGTGAVPVLRKLPVGIGDSWPSSFLFVQHFQQPSISSFDRRTCGQIDNLAGRWRRELFCRPYSFEQLNFVGFCSVGVGDLSATLNYWNGRDGCVERSPASFRVQLSPRFQLSDSRALDFELFLSLNAC